MRSALWATVISTALLAPPHAVFAQAFPGKTVRLVIPFPVGGSSDANARIIIPPLIERWKQQVMVDPRPGAATVIGTDYVAKSPPDGHTLLLNSTQYTQSPALFAKLPYDPHTDLVPITLISISPQAIVAHPSLPVRNVKELIALARARPGELNIGNAGSVLPTHLFTMLAKVKIETVPYKGAGPLMIDVMGGHVPLAIGAVSSVQAAVRSGPRADSRRLLALGGVPRCARHREGRARLRRRHVVRLVRAARHAQGSRHADTRRCRGGPIIRP